MNILAVNWLDLENPHAGGAEVHFHELFGRLARGGDAVTLVTSGWPGAAARAVVDGVEVRRTGGRHSFALLGRRAVARALRERSYDVVVEDINKLPLYLPTLTGLPTYVIVPHLFGGTAFREASLPVATLVWLAERAIPRVYRRCAFQAISESTKEDLERRGVPADSIRVIHPGVDAEFFAPDPGTPRAPRPTFLYVGRLKRYKGIETAIRAVAVVRGRHPDATLLIAGSGSDRDRLERIVQRSGLGAAVRFLGYVSDAEKRRLLREAWALVFPSAKEGWGMANVESAACGTPAIAANRPGLRESVVHGETGFLVPHDDPLAMAGAMTALIREPARIEALGRQARAFAASLTWAAAAAHTRHHLVETVRAQARPAKGAR